MASRPAAWSWLLLFAASAVHTVICPFTKVEESFGLQAIHDIMFHGTDLSKYDHHMFPGVVPRSFLGPGVVAGFAQPVVLAQTAVFTALDPSWESDPEASRLYAQLTARLMLAALVTLAFRDFQLAAATVFGATEATLLGVITSAQFHLPFYMSRPLPNVFALALVLLGLAGWLRGDQARLISCFVPAVVVFRAELVVFLGPLMLGELIAGRITFGRMLTRGVLTGLACLAVTIACDSWFWGRLLWPEGEVLYYNTVLNKSKDWGVLPFGWYFYSAIPKAMSASLVLCVAGLVADRRVWRLLAPAGAFVLLYSFLPHKELRFIVYVFPVLNLGAAVGFARIWRFKFWGQRLLQLTAVGLIVGTLLTTALFATASSMNYPGGVALQQAHSLDYAAMSLRPPISIHIAVPPAQTGISRFGESLSGAFTYSKAETWTNEIGPDNFDLMITGPEGPDIYENRTVAFAVEGFAGIGIQKKWPFIFFKTTEQIVGLIKSTTVQ